MIPLLFTTLASPQASGVLIVSGGGFVEARGYDPDNAWPQVRRSVRNALYSDLFGALPEKELRKKRGHGEGPRFRD